MERVNITFLWKDIKKSFNISKNIDMCKLFNSYSSIMGVSLNKLVFHYRGIQIFDDTPISSFNSNDIIINVTIVS